jgi:hypothetical protein
MLESILNITQKDLEVDGNLGKEPLSTVQKPQFPKIGTFIINTAPLSAIPCRSNPPQSETTMKSKTSSNYKTYTETSGVFNNNAFSYKSRTTSGLKYPVVPIPQHPVLDTVAQSSLLLLQKPSDLTKQLPTGMFGTLTLTKQENKRNRNI